MKIILLTFVAFSFLLSGFTVYAQDVSLGTAIPIVVSDQEVQDGDLISSKEAGGYIRSQIPYDPLLFGVISLDPALYLYDKAAKDEVPVITAGKAYVRVSTANGQIKRGDAITSSQRKGVGVKATDNGFVIGYAQEDYSAPNANQIGKILVNINPHFAQLNNNLFNSLFSLPRLTFSVSPLNTLRYTIAAVVGVAAFFIAFRFFGRATLEGVRAIGRNPLAKKEIILIVLINAALTVGVMLIGFVIAYLILVI